MNQQLNDGAFRLYQETLANAESWRVQRHKLANEATVVDFGVNTPGGIRAGLMLASICMSGRAEITLHPANATIGPWSLIQVATDDPVHACMASQYAGWPVKKDKFFAMGSGPMRTKRGKELVLKSLNISDESPYAVGVLECDSLPDES